MIVDETQKITFINSAFARMLGCAAGEILGHPASEFLNDATQRSMAGTIEPPNPGDVQRYEHTWLRKNGTTIPTAISLRPTFDRRHRYSGSLRVVSNLPELEGMQSIGEHPERERDFRAAVYSAIQRVSLDGILLVDSQEQIISYNQRFVEIWKVPPELIAGKSEAPVLEVVAGQVTDREVFLARVRKLYAQVDEASRDEIALKDGRTLDRYSAPVRLDDGTYLGRVWFFRDITERQRATDLLQASEERFRLLVEQAPDAIVLYDVDADRFVSANKSATTLFGCNREDLLKLGPRDFFIPDLPDGHALNVSDEANTRIRFRKDGDLEDYLELQPAYCNALVSRIKIMANLDISEHRHSQDGKIAFGKVGPVPIDLRVAVVPTSNNREDVVLRILGGVEPLPLEELGLPGRDLDELRKMISRSYGLFLVCGPTGSGKTTTLHSVLHHINRPDIKIWTAEDPVEITQSGLRQVQINSRIGWTFAAAMRAFLRADPDVIMVGEMRDAETTRIGIEASLTGHLVFSTLHTNSAAESVVRLLDLGMDPFNFADALIGILSQRLARKLCSKCKRSHVGSEAEIAELLDEYCAETDLDKAAVLQQWRKGFASDGLLVLYEASGCEACRGGYKGRVGVYELLSGTPDVKQLVRSRASVPQIVVAARAGGMRLLRQDAIEQILRGILDRASARSVSS